MQLLSTFKNISFNSIEYINTIILSDTFYLIAFTFILIVVTKFIIFIFIEILSFIYFIFIEILTNIIAFINITFLYTKSKLNNIYVWFTLMKQAIINIYNIGRGDLTEHPFIIQNIINLVEDEDEDNSSNDSTYYPSSDEENEEDSYYIDELVSENDLASGDDQY